jgi:hypothetical protein
MIITAFINGILIGLIAGQVAGIVGDRFRASKGRPGDGPTAD